MIVTTRSAATSSCRCTTPDGHVTSTSFARASRPKPNRTAFSLELAYPTDVVA